MENNNKKEATCPHMSDFDTAVDKPGWLKLHGHEVCPGELEAYVLLHHKIKAGDIIIEQPGSPLTLTLTEVLEALRPNTFYQAYLTVVKNGNNITGITTTVNFRTQPSCYSIPLINAIASLPGVSGNTNIEFRNAIVKNRPVTTIMKILGAQNVSYFDYSDNPTITPGKDPA